MHDPEAIAAMLKAAKLADLQRRLERLFGLPEPPSAPEPRYPERRFAHLVCTCPTGQHLPTCRHWRKTSG